jgi:hypothetical protein
MDAHHAGFDLPIRINYTPPVWLAGFILFTHFGAMGCLLLMHAWWLLKVLLWLLLLLSLVVTIRRQSPHHTPAGFVVDNHNRWLIIGTDSRPRQARLVSAGILATNCVCLLLQDDMGQKHAFILTSGNLDQVTLRRLRVRLYYPRQEENRS